MAHPSLADLQEFGPPIYVPTSTPWCVAGVEHTDGSPDGVLVFGGTGDLEIRTRAVATTRQPLSIRVNNLQAASAQGQLPTSSWYAVLVDEADESVMVDGVERPVRMLKSSTMFSFELDLEERVVSVAGTLATLESLAITRLEDLAVSG